MRASADRASELQRDVARGVTIPVVGSGALLARLDFEAIVVAENPL
jgi:hypothetical protein